MIPIHLRISGFLSYREPVDLDFTGLDLACISGQNGAGKSSLLDAITWALFGIARKKDDSLINSACSAAEVVLTFAYENNVYCIQRSKPREKTGVLEFFIHTNPDTYVHDPAGNSGERAWRPLTEHSIRETEQAIRSTLRLDFETFTNASFFLQGKADQFATQPPGDRKRILGSILGLEVWETYRLDAAERRKVLELECTTLDGRLREINSELAEENDRIARLQDLENRLAQQSQARRAQEEAVEGLRRLKQVLDRQREIVGKLKQQSQETMSSLQALEATLTSRQAERSTFQVQISQASEIEAAYQAWQDDRQELEKWDLRYSQFREQEKERAQPLMEIEKARALLEQEMRGLETGNLAVAADRVRLAELQRSGSTLEQAITLEGDLTVQKAAVEANLQVLRQQLAEAKAENPRLMKEMEEIKEHIHHLQDENVASCPVCGQDLTGSNRQTVIERLTAEGTRLGIRYRENRSLLTQFESQNSNLEGQLIALSRRERELAASQRQLDQVQHQIQSLEEKLVDWDKNSAPRLLEVLDCLKTSNYAFEARKRLAEVDANLLAVGYDPAHHTLIRQREQAGRANEVKLRQLGNARAALQPLEREIAGLETQAAGLRERAESQDAEYQQALAEYQKAAEGAPPLEPAEQALSEALEHENRLRMEVGAARQKVEILKVQRTRQAKFNQQRDELTHRIGLYKSLERAFSKDGVPAMLIEQALPEIESHANDILQRLSAGAMSVSFATQREYKDRNRDDRKETLDIRISDASGIRDYEMFSGGEAFRVNFAIRLALSRVLAHRAGARLQTLVIDEGFGSQDALGRQRLIEAINAVRPEFARILVITHMEELKDNFPFHIEVEKTDHGSHVRVV